MADILWQFVKDHWVLILICWIVLSFPVAVYTGRMIRMKDLPGCFNSNPGPQERAENDCIHCEWNDLCLRGPARFTAEELERK